MNWKYHNPKFEYEEKFDDSAWPWFGHRYFAYDLVTNIKPKRIVELGTHYGTSFWSFSQAVKDEKIDTELNAVDTWKGEDHSGIYGEEVFEMVKNISKGFYSGLKIHLIRKTFDKAVLDFEDNSIDILHIDGLHTYQAVKHDFETWLPKVNNNGIILFHDIKVGENDFGVYKFWEELREKYVTIEFFQSYGLGVLFLDKNLGEEFEKNEKEWQMRYSYIYEAGKSEAIKERDSKIQLKTQEIQNREQDIQVKDKVIQTKDKAIQTKDKEIENKIEIIRSKNEEISSKNLEIKNSNHDLDLIRTQLGLKANELSEIHQSKGWRAVVFIRNIINKFIPKGSMRRKIVKFFIDLCKRLIVLLVKVRAKVEYVLKSLKKLVQVLKRDGPVIFTRRVVRYYNNKKKYSKKLDNSLHHKPFFVGELGAKDIAVIVHLYYTDMWPDIAKRLVNIPYGYTLIVSLTDNHFDKSILKDIRKFKQDTKIYTFENKGMDILPFLKCLSHVDKKIKYVLKIHSKKSFHSPMVGLWWFNDLLRRVLPSKDDVDQILQNLEYTDVGMIGGSVVEGCDRTFVRGELREPKLAHGVIESIYDYFSDKESAYNWISGTIFWVRFDLVAKLADDKFIEFIENHQPVGYIQNDSIVHGLERYFGKLVYDAGKVISLDPIKRYSKNYITLLPEYHITKSRKDIYLFFHICCIGNYTQVVSELVDSLTKSGLYDESKKIYYSIVGKPSDTFLQWLSTYTKFECVHISVDIREVEYPILFYLYDFCKKNDAYVMYFHTKGVSNEYDEYKIAWRKRLIQKTIYEYKTCVSFLNKGCDVSGCGWKEHPHHHSIIVDYSTWTHSHFSGNFWWAKSSYIRQLPNMKFVEANYRKIGAPTHIAPPDFDIYRVMCEMWIGLGKNFMVGVNGDLNKEYFPLEHRKNLCNKKTILFISHDNSLTGAPKILFEIAGEYKKSHPEHNTVIVCSDITGLNNDGLRRHKFSSINDVIYNFQIEYCDTESEESIQKTFLKHQPSLIYANSVVSGKWVKYAVEHNVPYIWHIHEKKKAMNSFMKAFDSKFTRAIKGECVISVSADAKKDLNSFGIFGSTLIHAFINTDKIDDIKNISAPLPEGLNPNEKIIICVGAVAYRKGTDIFIEAARRIPDLQFLWVGNVYDEDIIRNVPRNFFHVEYTDNPYYYMSISSLFVLPSREDPFPLVILESLYINKPTVCFSDGVGSAELMRKEGFVIDGEANVEDMVTFIHDYDFNHPPSIKSASQYIKENYSNYSQMPKIQSIIKKELEHNQYDSMVDYFTDKIGIEIGGPSEIFKLSFPIYEKVKKIDGVNFSETTLWDSRRAGQSSFEYYDGKKGDQYISEATELKGIASGSYDFLLASHCLEHTANPIKAMMEWIRVVKPGGMLLVIVPNKELCFDHKRDYSTLEHLMDDYEKNVLENDLSHLDEILKKHDLSMDHPAGTFEQFKKRSLQNHLNRALHQHVFSLDLLKEVFIYSGLSVEKSFVDGINIVCIGRVHDK